MANVKGEKSPLTAFMFLLLLVAVFYPCLAFQRVLAPQALLWIFPPWNDIGGPNPVDRPELLQTALTLAPRLHLVQQHGLGLAVWNPYIGNGRVGFLSFAADGYPPLAVLAALLVSPEFLWNALLLLQLALAFSGAFFLARRFHSTEAATVAGVAYCLSGPVLSQWHTLAGSVAALGPWLWLSAFEQRRGLGGITAALLFLSGGESWLFLLGYLSLPLLVHPAPGRVSRLRDRLLSLAWASLFAFPSLYLSFFGGETPGFWWLHPSPQGPPKLLALVQKLPEHNPNSSPSLYLGWPLIVLAMAGLAWGKGAAKFKLGLGALVPAAFFVFAVPKTAPPFFPGFRPTSVLALGVALLAGAGADLVFQGLFRARNGWASAFLSGLLALPLVASGARSLPWEAPERAHIPAPWDQVPWAAGDPVLPLLTLFPPDSAGFLSFCDPRAKSFAGEPRYRTLLNPAPDGSVHFSRVTDPTLPELGVKWLVEPEQFQVVREELLRHSFTDEAPRQGLAYRLLVPPQATRLGLMTSASPSFLRLEQAGNTRILLPDQDLLSKEGWRFWRLPPETAAGPANLVADGTFAQAHPQLTVVWDTSGWERVGAAEGFNFWRQKFARPLASWLEAGLGLAPPKILRWRPEGVVLAASPTTPQRLLVRLKYRPGLLRVAVDGKRVVPRPAALVWTEIPVPKGDHRVTVRYALPLWTWILPTAAVIALGRKKKVAL